MQGGGEGQPGQPGPHHTMEMASQGGTSQPWTQLSRMLKAACQKMPLKSNFPFQKCASAGHKNMGAIGQVGAV